MPHQNRAAQIRDPLPTVPEGWPDDEASDTGTPWSPLVFAAILLSVATLGFRLIIH